LGWGSHAIRIQGWRGRVRRPPDHASRTARIEYLLLENLVCSHISEASREDEHDLVLHDPRPVKDVLQNSRQPNVGERPADFLAPFAPNADAVG